MVLTPEETEAQLLNLEGRLEGLEEENKILKGSRQINPFENLEFQLALENGHTVSARTRRMNMVLGSNPNGDSAGGEVTYADGVTRAARFYCVVPSDWVEGTSITLNILLLQTATGGSPTCVLNSNISIQSDQDTFSDTNVENNASVNLALTQNILEIQTRTIAASLISDGDQIRWTHTRSGGSGSDAVNDLVFITHGAWVSYTAFF